MIYAYGIWRKGYYIIFSWSWIYNTAQAVCILYLARGISFICLPIKTVLYQMFGPILVWNPLWNFALLKGSISVYKEIADCLFRRLLLFACFFQWSKSMRDLWNMPSAWEIAFSIKYTAVYERFIWFHFLQIRKFHYLFGCKYPYRGSKLLSNFCEL